MKTPNWFLKRNIVAYLLLGFSIVYYIISKSVYFVRKIFQKSSKRPVICIGNILAGGVGKTPLVMEIAKALKSPVVMRGYKKHHDSDCLGDEAKMLKKAGIDVYVGSRTKNVELLNRQKSQSPIVMDDGFQNPLVKKDISVLVFDENIGIGNGFVLPAGPLREPGCAIKRSDAVIIIKSQKPKANCKNKFIKNVSNYGVSVFYAHAKTIVPKTNHPMLAFAGIGYPQKFFDALGVNRARTMAYPDHHQYTADDVKKLSDWADLDNSVLVTTEKDWVRLPAEFQKKVKVAKLETTLEPAFWTWLDKRLK